MGKLFTSLKNKLVHGTGFEYKKSLRKLGIGLIAAILLATVTYFITYIQAANLDPQYTVFVGFAIAILNSTTNAIKHWKDEELK